MKTKSIIIGGVLIVGIGIGVFAILKSSGTSSSGGDNDEAPAAENVPTVVSVETGTLRRMTLHRYVNGYGTVEAAPATASDPGGGGTLAASGAGVVTKVNVVTGQQVEKGDVLVEFNSAAMTFDFAQAEWERQKQLFEQQNTSQKNLQDAEAQLASLEVVAPVTGMVTRLNAKTGQAVDASTVVAEVIDLNRLAVNAKISAAAAGDLKAGNEVEILSQPPVPALLSVVSPAVDPSDGSISIWAPLPADSGLRPGQFVPLKIVTAVASNCLAAPAKSVVTDEAGKSVIALVKGDEATQMPVTIGLREDDWLEITGANLNEGDVVVTVGAYGLPEKTKIRLANAPAGETPATNSADAQ